MDKNQPKTEMLPFDREAEQAVLGAILLNQKNLRLLAGYLTPDSFYLPAHRDIFAALLGLETDQEPIDELTLVHLLRERNQLEAVGGATYVASLGDVPPATVNVLAYAEIVRDLALARTITRAAMEIAQQGGKTGHRGTVSILHQARRVFQDIEARQRILGTTSAADAVAKIDAQMLVFEQHPARVMAYMDVDQFVQGFEPGYVHIIGARTSQGKSTTLSQIGLFNGLRGVPSLTFTLEMFEWEYVTRQVCQYQGLPGWKWLKGALGERSAEERRKFDTGKEEIARLPMYFAGDGRRMAMDEIGYVARAHIREYGVKAVFLDHLKMIPAPAKKEKFYDAQSWRVEELSELAKETAVPWFVCAQINREGDTRPRLIDLEGSGTIEQYAGVVLLQHCPDMERRDVLDINVAKGRNNRTGTLSFPWYPSYFRVGPGRVVESGPPLPGDEQPAPLHRTKYQQDPLMQD